MASQRSCHGKTKPTRKRIFGIPNPQPLLKDSINDFLIHGKHEAVNPEKKRHEGGGGLSPNVNPGNVE